MSVEGDWSGRLVGADFGGDGQILVWLQPGPDGYLQRVEQQPQIDNHVEAIVGIIAENNRPPWRPALPEGGD